MTARLQPRRAEAGFTLIELLVALTLVGLISVVLFGGLRFGTRAWEAGNLQAERLAQVQAVQALLRRRIAQALPPKAGAKLAGDLDRRATFAGEAAALHFVATVPSRAGVGGIYSFDLAAIEDGEGARLELTWRLYRPDEPDRFDAPEPGLGGRRVLIDGIESAAFAYYGASGRGQPADWHDRWESDSGLPAVIAIEVAFPEGDRRSWPVLQVAPKLAATAP
jgi:general secretion pathway protein J